MKCLLIDDSPIDLLVQEKVVHTIFKQAEIFKAQTAQEALQWLNDNCDAFPQIIFLDINMPIMSGFDFLEEFKNQFSAQTSSTRIFIVSSSLDPVDLNKAEKEELVKGYLTKPLKLEEVKNLVG